MIKERIKQLNRDGDLFYTIISIAALVISVVLLCVVIFSGRSRTPLHDPGARPLDTSGESAAKNEGHGGENGAAFAGAIEVTNEQASRLIAAAMPEDFPIKDIGVLFHEDSLFLKGSAMRDAFAVYLAKDLDGLPGLFRGALSIMPEETEVSLDIGLSSSDERALEITPKSISIGSISFDASMLPERMSDTLKTAINESVTEYGSFFTKIEVREGVLWLYP